ncbi:MULTISPECIES: metal-dependent transcriptional regulator [Actinomyces]|uniref:Metal-dependent transcriptional regulator n=1 Tax=Actinomyces marmotae TaxID=2737173 RepID=A0A6M8B1Z0_9ACTO|nr:MULTISPECIES: metal-dependent transcriptional regulator [Actinomyces]QKD80348.1 metal-dependent transcriptional regulator [Actinomyces marmotae]
MSELIDTTEMYLKTVYELEEDGVTPLRARIVDRLDHSGPTVSQTVARMERDGLIRVTEDRSLELTEEGRRRATEVIRKHRLAERLLLDVVGVDRRYIHDEACRWEHVMSERVEDRLAEILGDVATDPFGNPIPGRRADHPAPGKDESSANRAVRDGVGSAVVRRIGEPIQADGELLGRMEDAGICAGARVELRGSAGGVRIVGPTGMPIVLPDDVARHLFLEQGAPAV